MVSETTEDSAARTNLTTTSVSTALGSVEAPARDRGVVRVLHVNSGNLYGGVETILASLARLKDFCPAMESEFALCFEDRLARELAAAGAPMHWLGNVRISRPWTVWRARRRLKELLGRKRFDLVICHMPWSMAVLGPTC